MRILVFGDSIARGSFDTECGGWANRLSAAFNEKTFTGDEYYNTYNLGIGGETAAELVDRIPGELAKRTAAGSGEIVSIVLSGTNDTKVFVEENKNMTLVSDFEMAYTKIVKTLKEQSDHVFCLGLTRMDEQKTNPIAPNNQIAFRNEELARYEAVIENITKDEDVHFIKLADTFSEAELSPDGIHPNAEGHRLIFERVKGELEKAGIL